MSYTICNMGMLIPKNDELTDTIKKELTVVPYLPYLQKIGKRPKSYKIYRETKNYLVVPVYYKNFLNYKLKFPPIEILKDFPKKDNIVLKDNQKEIYTSCMKIFDKEIGGRLLNANTGSGKTVITIKILCSIKLKTLIVVNKINLLVQWENELKKFIPDIKIGKIQGETFDIEDKHIVLGMLQTISMKDNIQIRDFTSIDFLVIDEAHNFASEVFSNLLFKVNPRYKLGLTATIERQDRLEKVFLWHLGDIIYTDKFLSKKQISKIITVNTDFDTTEDKLSRILTEVSEYKVRNDLIIKILDNFDIERKILVLSDRIEQLKYLHNNLQEKSGLYIGKMKQEQLEKSKEKQIVLATYQIASEGFNLPELNTLLFATPRSNIKQSIGRIYRKEHTITPIIIDIIDQNIDIYKAQFYKRKKIYKDSIEKIIWENDNYQEIF